MPGGQLHHQNLCNSGLLSGPGSDRRTGVCQRQAGHSAHPVEAGSYVASWIPGLQAQSALLQQLLPAQTHSWVMVQKTSDCLSQSVSDV